VEKERKRKRLASVGRPIPGCEVRLLDDDGQDVPPGKVGEIVARGPKMMKGYWQNEEATNQTIKEGWLYTGDLAWMDEEGYLFLQGRKKDMIIRGGENIYPVEIENVLHRHPKIEEAAVIGVPDEYWGEIVEAVVVLREGEQATEEEIIEYCRSRMASYKKPARVKFKTHLPKNAMQKVLKHVLREEAIRERKGGKL
jgi:long-chain acyl-CoA synthetase